MRKHLNTALKHHIRSELLKVRGETDLTQEKMAHCLLISTRAYASLESETSCCSLLTFLLFLYYFCPDRLTFLENLFADLHFSALDAA